MCSVHSNTILDVSAAFAFMLPSMCRNNAYRGESTQVAGCAMLGAGRQEVVPLKSQVREKYTVHSPALSGLACTAAGLRATPLCTL